MICYTLYFTPKPQNNLQCIFERLSSDEIHKYNDSFFDKLIEHLDDYVINLTIDVIEEDIWPLLYPFLLKPIVLKHLKAIRWPINTRNHKNMKDIIHLTHLNPEIGVFFHSFNFLKSDYSYEDDIILQSIRLNDLRSKWVVFLIDPRPRAFGYFYHFISSMISNDTIRQLSITNHYALENDWRNKDTLFKMNTLLEMLISRKSSIERFYYKISQKCADITKFEEFDLILSLFTFESVPKRNRKNNKKKSLSFTETVSKNLTF